MAKYQSPALDKGLDIIEYLSNITTPQSQTEIALGINKKPNEIYRMLVCLEERGYIVKNPVSAKFKLSLKLLHLARRLQPTETLRLAAIYPMQELSALSRHSCHLSILDNQNMLVLAQNPSPEPIALCIQVGSKFPIIHSFSGSISLSQLSPEERQRIFDKTADFHNLTDKKKQEYNTLLESISKKGYDIRESRSTKGVVDIGVPLYIPELDINATLCATILSGQVQELIDSNYILDRLKSTIKDIRFNLGLQ
ncbi:IclR family transcriptional regulator [Arenibacter certesii]|uniref:IclR family transcriptional regulator n=1 Tax=Arenibacter certesii TaxID=228955 RepID=A0A918J2F4_9FLAO|nr:helix-turn-helix domain-containing protein [Arenibacter certesii]GGW42106.1 IclR family transcriptional regulator [Arenibacter certesii]